MSGHPASRLSASHRGSARRSGVRLHEGARAFRSMGSHSNAGRGSSDRNLATQEKLAFDLGWIGRNTGHAERRQVVVLAVGFDPFEVSDPEELVETLARRRSFVQQIVSLYGGTVGRIDPNLQIVAWGWPMAGEADTRFAVAAALEIAADPGHAPRCGIDAGIAITAETGSDRFDLGFVGEMVGSAVANQAAAPPGKVCVGAAVDRLIRDAFVLVECKERQGEAPLWLVAGRRAQHRGRLPGLGRQRVTIGRDREKQEIKALLAETKRGAGQLLRIEGEAGVGKTALVDWIEQEAVDSLATFIVLQCLPEVQHKPLRPIDRIVGQIARLPSPWGREPAAGEALSNAFPCNGDVAGLALLQACREELASVEPAVMALGRRLAEFISYKSRARALVLVVEDMHWADEATVRVIESLEVLAGRGVAVLLVVTSRPDPESGGSAARGSRWRRQRLGRLAHDEILHLLDTGELSAKLDAETRERIAQRSDGIPFYALELAGLCAQNADREGDHRLLARPNKLNAALTGRLDALETLKPLAQAAAVLGRLFDGRILAAVLGMDERVIDERLVMLVDMGLLIRRRAKGGSYRFHDALLWSQAYGSVLKGRRRDLHRRIAGIMQGPAGERFEVKPELVAHHWKKAGVHAKAFEWWFRAAMEAAERGAAAKAVAFINHALTARQLAPEVCSAHDEATLMSVLGSQLRVLRGSSSREAVAAYERAMEVVSSMAARPVDIDLEIAWGVATIHLVRGDIQAAAESSSRLLAEASERHRDDICLLALRVHGTARLLGGSVSEAIGLFEDATARYARGLHGEFQRRLVSDPGAITFAHLATAYAVAGNAQAARDRRDQALHLAVGTKHAHTTANVLGVLTISAVHMGEAGIAGALARGCREIASREGFKYWVTRSDIILAWAGAAGDEAGCVEAMRQALLAYSSTGSSRAAVFSACLAAEVALKAGRPDDALAFLAPVRNAGEQRGEWLYMPEVRRLEACALLQRDAARIEMARQMLAEAEAISRWHGSVVLLARIEATRGHIERAAKRRHRSARAAPELT